MTVNQLALSKWKWYTQSDMLNKNTSGLIANRLLDWYEKNARDLPWRSTSDPYKIWVSEIMLQQTRVETVLPYYQRWMERFPTAGDLAEAEEDEVLNSWEGLGYYRRALNLYRAVKEVQDNYGGEIPKDPQKLEGLPGIGPYTAGAISSIAFDQQAPILDGNIRRVFSRLFKIQEPLGESKTERGMWDIARELVPAKRPGDFNQALMELGALICLPSNPKCDICPLHQLCSARDLGIQDQLPIRKKKNPLPHLQVTAAIFQKNKKVLLTKRPPEGLLGGMWEFPGGKQEENETLQETLIREINEELGASTNVGDLQGVYSHAYTHYKVTLHAFFCKLLSTDLMLNYHTQYAWVPIDSLDDYPMGKIDRLISQQLQRNL
jgi:A/G-specific adenine glycosylase